MHAPFVASMFFYFSKTMSGVARGIWRREGIRGFYHGASPAILRGFPANAALFSGS